MNAFIENNIVNNKVNTWMWYHALVQMSDFPFRPFHNTWDKNYWEDWHVPIPKPIKSILMIDVLIFDREIFYTSFPCYNFDFHPAMKPV